MNDPSRNDDAGFDLILVGGGLANCLAALRLLQRRPQLRMLLIEAGDKLVDNKTWSFYESDLSAEQLEWVSPLIGTSWPENKVRFPRYERTFPTFYHSIPSENLRKAVEALPNVKALTGAQAADVGVRSVSLRDGRAFRAPAVIDGRGFEGSPHLTLGYQKFIGLEVVTEEPHGETAPTIMDATVSQRDGYRFVYLLPFDERRILIEDTRYTDGKDFDANDYRAGVNAYAEARGWRIKRVEREERGVLPISLAFDADDFWAGAERQPPQVGLRAALFHPTTGYSFPDAVRTVDLIASAPRLESGVVAALIKKHALQVARDHDFFRLLNRMLFKAARTELRYRVLQRFYTLPPPLIDRFYANALTGGDKARLLVGIPPVPISRALRVLSPNSDFDVNERNIHASS